MCSFSAQIRESDVQKYVWIILELWAQIRELQKKSALEKHKYQLETINKLNFQHWTENAIRKKSALKHKYKLQQ